jgi:hypothetical protein
MNVFKKKTSFPFHQLTPSQIMGMAALTAISIGVGACGLKSIQSPRISSSPASMPPLLVDGKKVDPNKYVPVNVDQVPVVAPTPTPTSLPEAFFQTATKQDKAGRFFNPEPEFQAKDCQGKLDTEAELKLVGYLSALNQSVFDNSISAAEKAQRLKDLQAANPGVDAKELGSLVALSDDVALSSFRARLILKVLNGESVASEKKKLTELGQDPKEFDLFVDNVKNNQSDYFSALKSVGAVYDSGSGWDFSNADLSPKTLQSNPKVSTSLMLFVSSKAALSLLDPERTEAVALGSFVILPPEHPGGKTPVFTTDRYQEVVKALLGHFKLETENFISASKKRATYWNLMSGARTKQGQTASDIEAISSYNAMLTYKNKISDYYGVPAELSADLAKASLEALKIDEHNLDAGLKKISMAKTAALTAPLIPISMYAAPIFLASSVGNFTLATELLTGTGTSFTLLTGTAATAGAASLTAVGATLAAETTVATAAVMPALFQFGSAAMEAVVDASVNGGSFMCYFKENAMTAAAGSLSQGAMMAGIASGGYLLGGTAAFLGFGPKAVAIARTGFDTSSALYFLARGGISAYQGLNSCYVTVRDMHLASQSEAGPEIVRAMSAQAYKICLQGGIDTAFFFTSSAKMSKSAWDGYRQYKASQPESPEGEKADTDLANDPDFNAKGNLYDLNLDENPAQAQGLDTKLIEKMNGRIPQIDDDRVASVNHDIAKQVYDAMSNHEVASVSQLKKYDPDGRTGFCFGRATSVHMELLARGVQKESIRKVWAIGEMDTGEGFKWGHHVATAVQADEGGWWVIDTSGFGLKSLPDWLAEMNKYSANQSIRLVVTSPSRFGPKMDAAYSRGEFGLDMELKDDFYKGFFKDLMASFSKHDGPFSGARLHPAPPALAPVAAPAPEIPPAEAPAAAS